MVATVDRAVRKKVTKGRVGVGWDSIVEKVWKGIEGNQEEVTSVDKFGRQKTEANEIIERWKD